MVFFRRLKEKTVGFVKAVHRLEKSKPLKERKLVTFVNDRPGQIKHAFNAYFYRIASPLFGSPSRVKNRLKHNNNRIERHIQDIKQDTK